MGKRFRDEAPLNLETCSEADMRGAMAALAAYFNVSVYAERWPDGGTGYVIVVEEPKP